MGCLLDKTRRRLPTAVFVQQTKLCFATVLAPRGLKWSFDGIPWQLFSNPITWRGRNPAKMPKVGHKIRGGGPDRALADLLDFSWDGLKWNWEALGLFNNYLEPGGPLRNYCWAGFIIIQELAAMKNKMEALMVAKDRKAAPSPYVSPVETKKAKVIATPRHSPPRSPAPGSAESRKRKAMD